jgi:hypothetical protein
VTEKSKEAFNKAFEEIFDAAATTVDHNAHFYVPKTVLCDFDQELLGALSNRFPSDTTGVVLLGTPYHFGQRIYRFYILTVNIL